MPWGLCRVRKVPRSVPARPGWQLPAPSSRMPDVRLRFAVSVSVVKGLDSIRGMDVSWRRPVLTSARGKWGEEAWGWPPRVVLSPAAVSPALGCWGGRQGRIIPWKHPGVHSWASWSEEVGVSPSSPCLTSFTADSCWREDAGCAGGLHSSTGAKAAPEIAKLVLLSGSWLGHCSVLCINIQGWQ